jgi:hypothetical protein
MNNREKVIKALECCSSESGRDTCPPECPYAKDFSCQGTFTLMRDALELLKAQPEPQAVTLDDMLVIRARTFLNESEVFHLKYRLEQQIRNGDRVLILPDFLEPVIVPKDTEVHIETEPIGVFPGRINPSLSVHPPRIPPKRG